MLEEESLHEIYSEIDHDLTLFNRLDTLRDHIDTDRLGHRNRSLHDSARQVIASELTDDRAIDLHHTNEIEISDSGQRAMGDTEVVDHDSAAEFGETKKRTIGVIDSAEK